MRKIAVAVCLLAVVFAGCGNDDDPTFDAGLPEPTDIEVIAKDYEFSSAPATVNVDSLATLTVKNEGNEDHEATILKINTEKTFDDVRAFFGPSAPPGPPPFAVAGGTTGTAAGTSTAVTQALEAGSYAFICLIESPDGTPHFAKGMLKPFAVTGNSTASLPLPDGVNATGTEYKFNLPTLKAGTTTIRFTNEGNEDHALGLAKVADGKDATAALKWLQDHQGPPPVTFMGGPVVGPRGRNSFEVKLSEGTYVFYCPVPVQGDPQQTPHFSRGMFQAVTIS